MRLQIQPTPVTCVQTCLAMALDVPVEQVIRHYGPEPMNAKGLLNALTECGIQWNQLTQGTMLHTGFYFAVVPSLNHRGGMHQIVIAYDSGTGGMTVFDPAIGNRYKEDGSDLISWAELVAFYPGGRLPSSVRPTIVCLCGSTRFMEAFQRANFKNNALLAENNELRAERWGQGVDPSKCPDCGGFRGHGHECPKPPLAEPPGPSKSPES